LKDGIKKNKSQSKSKYKNVECHYCNEFGYIKKYCFKWKNESKGKKIKQKDNDHGDNDHVTTISDDLILLCDYESINLVSDESM